MKYFLLVFDRAKGQLVRPIAKFGASEEAVRARFECEATGLGQDIEVVVLGAESEQALRETHARYFGDDRELSPA
jgi:hypothetical protein